MSLSGGTSGWHAGRCDGARRRDGRGSAAARRRALLETDETPGRQTRGRVGAGRRALSCHPGSPRSDEPGIHFPEAGVQGFRASPPGDPGMMIFAELIVFKADLRRKTKLRTTAHVSRPRVAWGRPGDRIVDRAPARHREYPRRERRLSRRRRFPRPISQFLYVGRIRERTVTSQSELGWPCESRR